MLRSDAIMVLGVVGGGCTLLAACSSPEPLTLDPLPALIAAGEPARLPPLEPLVLQSDLPEPPSDFALAVSVISPQGLRTAHVPVDERAARYIVESDWHLRATVGRDLPRTTWPLRGGADQTFPGITRALSARDVAALNALVNDAGLPEAPALDVDPPANLSVPRDRIIYVVSTTQNQRRRWAMLDAQSAPPAARHLVRTLATLAYQEQGQ